MTRKDLEKMLTDALNWVTGLEKNRFTLRTRLKKDLELDSLDLVELEMKIEEKFGFVIKDEDLFKFKTVGDIYKFLEKRSDVLWLK